jgi:hypothetical protein
MGNRSRVNIAKSLMYLLRRLKVISETTYWDFEEVEWIDSFTEI